MIITMIMIKNNKQSFFNLLCNRTFILTKSKKALPLCQKRQYSLQSDFGGKKMKRIIICMLLTVMMITSCSVSEKNGADGRGAAVSTEAETGSAATSGSEEITEADSAAEAERNKTAAIPDGIKTLVSANADYSYGKHPMPENTLPPLKTDTRRMLPHKLNTK